jgi:hypothetical protein
MLSKGDELESAGHAATIFYSFHVGQFHFTMLEGCEQNL